MAALLESDVKRLLAAHGVPVPRGIVCTSPEAVTLAATTLRDAVVVKALIPSKGKQAAGGIHFADTPAEAARVAEQVLGTTVAGFEVREVLVEACERLTQEIYASVELDTAAKAYRLTVAAKGGANVERQLADGAGRSVRFHPRALPWAYQVRDLLIDCGLSGETLRHAPDAIVAICRAAVAADLTLLEVNPIGLRADSTTCAIGVLASLDESALHRQPDLAARAIPKVDQLLRPPTEWERRVDELNQALPDGGDIRFGEFPEGDIGMMVLGGGAGLMALDAVARAGGKPANFLDMTSTTGQAEEKVYRAVKLFLGVERLRGLLIGSNIGAFLPVPVRMRGIARALREGLPSKRRFPVVIRLAGIDDDQVEPIIEGLAMKYFRDDVTLEDAIDVFMRELEAAA
jgi:succinyl-CoA synthetase beta subunit/citryl-CoA synthetase large subunit